MAQFQQLVEATEGAGLGPRVCALPDGSMILVLRHGGRILGLFPPGCERNFFWTNQAIHTRETARQWAMSRDWHNSGGDRTWLAPEADFFFPEYPSLEKYRPPVEFDPGDYRFEIADGSPVLVSRFTLLSPGQQRSFVCELRKRVSAAPRPDYDDKLAYAGYTLTTSLRLLSPLPDPPWRVGLWNLLQMPHGGELLIPVSCRPEVRVLFGDIGGEDVETTERVVRYRMHAQGNHKLGIGPEPLKGRAGYFYTDGDEACLIVRNFHVDPSGEYVDVPWSEPLGAGTAFQACNVNNDIGTFSELEYHAPGLTSSRGATYCEDTSVVWAFRGSPALIRKAAQSMF